MLGGCTEAHNWMAQLCLRDEEMIWACQFFFLSWAPTYTLCSQIFTAVLTQGLQPSSVATWWVCSRVKFPESLFLPVVSALDFTPVLLPLWLWGFLCHPNIAEDVVNEFCFCYSWCSLLFRNWRRKIGKLGCLQSLCSCCCSVAKLTNFWDPYGL